MIALTYFLQAVILMLFSGFLYFAYLIPDSERFIDVKGIAIQVDVEGRVICAPR